MGESRKFLDEELRKVPSRNGSELGGGGGDIQRFGDDHSHGSELVSTTRHLHRTSQSVLSPRAEDQRRPSR